MTVYDWFSMNNIDYSWEKILKMVEEYVQEAGKEKEEEQDLITTTAEPIINDSACSISDELDERLKNLELLTKKEEEEKKIPEISNITISIDFK